MKPIGYNSQRNNFHFAGKFPGWSQCFSTSAWMFLSFYDPNCLATDDDGLSKYVDDVEAAVGGPGIAERVMRKFAWITGFTSLWWLTHKEALEERIRATGRRGQMVFRESNGTWEELHRVQGNCPAIVGTYKLGGLPGGHIILALPEPGYFHDPYGNAATGYVDPNGQTVNYQYDAASKVAFEVAGRGKLRYMFWEDEK